MKMIYWYLADHFVHDVLNVHVDMACCDVDVVSDHVPTRVHDMDVVVVAYRVAVSDRVVAFLHVIVDFVLVRAAVPFVRCFVCRTCLDPVVTAAIVIVLFDVYHHSHRLADFRIQ